MKQRLTVGFAGARWLGVECFKYLVDQKNLEIKSVCFPKKNEKVWWSDVSDEVEVNKLGYKVTTWDKWKNLKFDLVFSVLHGGIFKQEHLDNYRLGAINLHPAPLPEYRGCNSYAHAIINGDKSYRVTMHYIETGVDTGPIIDDGSLNIDISDTGYSLYLKAQKVALKVFKKNLPKILAAARADNLVKSRIQNEKKARYYPRTSLSSKEVDLYWKKKRIYNFVRALDFPPHEPAYAIVSGKRVYLTAGNPRSF